MTVLKGEMVVSYIFEPEAFMQRFLFGRMANAYFPVKHYLDSVLCRVPHLETNGGLFFRHVWEISREFERGPSNGLISMIVMATFGLGGGEFVGTVRGLYVQQ
jgi:hypothetical protein